MPYKMILTDLDGTLLRSDKTLSDYNRAAIDRAVEQGVLFVPCTGRVLTAMPEVVRTLPCVRYAVTINGAEIYRTEAGELLRRTGIEPTVTEDILTYLKNVDASVDCFISVGHAYMERRFYDALEDWVPEDHMRVGVRKNREPVDDLRAAIREESMPVLRLQSYFRDLTLRREVMAYIADRFPQVSVAASLPFNMEITHREANKGGAMRYLCERLGIAPDEVIAFGDELNDLPMLTAAGLGVAMDNASPTVKAQVRYVAETNEADGVGRCIRRFVLGESL